ncbi:stAR-related lipid transfer protein 6 [Balaenoptera ricei]|uniref:stAR-related lipid transfer protein 6 n=1 Tax=Balaenoptera ricei TaxID=2746895 RepID=UPI0028BDD18C|nr:stAR-related lipid transfer protein 6 [Balaenoptera ricei]
MIKLVLDYKALAQQTAQEILGYDQDTAGWKVVKTSKKISVYSKASKKFHGNLYRVEGIIPESTSKLSDFLQKPENRVTWDKSFKVYKMVQKIDSVIYCLLLDFHCMNTLLVFYVSDLSLLNLYYVDTLYFIDSNQLLVDFPAYPSSSNYIRGCNHACGYICSPLQENPAYSKLLMFVQTEMRGKLAPSIIEATMPSNLISFLLNVKDGLKTHKIPSGRGCHHNGHSSFLKKK